VSYNYSDCYPYYLNGSGPDYTLDPDSIDSFEFNWAADLQQDAILTSEMFLTDGLTQESLTRDGNLVTVFLSGAVEGRIYRVVNRVTTVSGKRLDKTIRILGQES
jgi:hypothetical protein